MKLCVAGVRCLCLDCVVRSLCLDCVVRCLCLDCAVRCLCLDCVVRCLCLNCVSCVLVGRASLWLLNVAMTSRFGRLSRQIVRFIVQWQLCQQPSPARRLTRHIQRVYQWLIRPDLGQCLSVCTALTSDVLRRSNQVRRRGLDAKHARQTELREIFR
jgi:hypothetical protein